MATFWCFVFYNPGCSLLRFVATRAATYVSTAVCAQRPLRDICCAMCNFPPLCFGSFIVTITCLFVSYFGVKVAENVKDQNIYARFVRKRRPNATIDKDLYRA